MRNAKHVQIRLWTPPLLTAVRSKTWQHAQLQQTFSTQTLSSNARHTF
ncbi:MAG: hypothetical protein OXU51_15740 [Candidatus Poribacteria bacterium]|nr:hypothetical protein [Candidatus Poribacteria bacterium]